MRLISIIYCCAGTLPAITAYKRSSRWKVPKVRDGSRKVSGLQRVTLEFPDIKRGGSPRASGLSRWLERQQGREKMTNVVAITEKKSRTGNLLIKIVFGVTGTVALIYAGYWVVGFVGEMIATVSAVSPLEVASYFVRASGPF